MDEIGEVQVPRSASALIYLWGSIINITIDLTASFSQDQWGKEGV